MNTKFCSYGVGRDETIVEYLYGELDASERAAFERHVAACAACETELTEFRAVREQLEQWTPPEVMSAVRRMDRTSSRIPLWTSLTEIPAWAQVAAALLVMGVAAGIANVEVRYGVDGLAVRTGWQSTAAVPATEVPSQADLSALEARIHDELRAAQDAAASSAPAPQASLPAGETNDAEIIRRVRTLVADSERRQQRELALRVAEVLRDVQAQRVADLQRIDRSLGIIQSNTGVEVMRQRQLLNNLAVRVSQQQ